MLKPAYKSKVDSRSDLLTLLSEACELEHGLACSYLYAAFSLKQDLAEGGMTWEQLHKVKKWAAQLYLVASQEMFHLAQAWNLLNAIGGSPYYLRPNFPQNSKYYPLHLPLSLEPFSVQALKRFILYELPRELDEKHYVRSEWGFQDEDDYEYKTVGELYGMITDGLMQLPEKTLFIGSADLQMGEQEADFPELVKVTDRESAIEAIHRIVEQGEGATPADQDNCHYGIFRAVLAEYQAEQHEAGSSFRPVRNAVTNPVVSVRGNYQAGRGNVITNDFAASVADLFDDLYNLMLRVLHFVFSSPKQPVTVKRELSRFAIAVMPMVIKPLGDALMQLPAGRLYPGKMAGPCFSMSRHVPLPADEKVTLKVISERSRELCDRARVLIQGRTVPASLQSAFNNLVRLQDYLRSE